MLSLFMLLQETMLFSETLIYQEFGAHKLCFRQKRLETKIIKNAVFYLTFLRKLINGEFSAL